MEPELVWRLSFAVVLALVAVVVGRWRGDDLLTILMSAVGVGGFMGGFAVAMEAGPQAMLAFWLGTGGAIVWTMAAGRSRRRTKIAAADAG